jgi:hypothetical protein
LDCELITAAEETDCIGEVQDELAGDNVATCAAAQQFYLDNKTAIDQCAGGGAGNCDNDDFTSYCPAWIGFDLEQDCRVEDSGDAGIGSGGSTSNGGAGGSSGSVELTTEQAVVGAWSGGAACGDASFAFLYFLCPGGRLRGVEVLNEFEFLACGTFSATAATVNTDYGVVAVIDSTFTDESHLQWTYSSSNDTLTWVADCPVELTRAVGEVTQEDCESSTCTAGGSGPVTCGTDCDCGRCWYCESGQCLYGGEGPVGCYRGCGF